jgi:hypothetical protein
METKKTCENDSLTKDVFGPTSARKLGKHLLVRKKCEKDLESIVLWSCGKRKEINNNNRRRKMQNFIYF